jgi:hypothetical protein
MSEPVNTSRTYQPFSTVTGSYSVFSPSFYFAHKFHKQPNSYRPCRLLYKDNCVEKLKKHYSTIFESVVSFRDSKDKTHEVLSAIAFEGKDIVVYLERSRLMENLSEDYLDDEYDAGVSKDVRSSVFSISIFYSERAELDKTLQHFEIHKTENKNNIFLITGTPGDGYMLREFTTKLPSKTKDFDLELNYEDDFIKKHKVILKRLKAPNDTGLIILNGKPGTGKTTYIKYLTTLLDKKIIFVPPAMAEGITAPNFLPFLMENKNCILVIEDAEKVVGTRDSNDTNNGVSNILNMTDGILGDCLNIQIIATLNTTKEKIDSALLRKGRLIADYEFKELPVEKVKKIFEKLKIKVDVTTPLTLTEIYNYEEGEASTQKKEPLRKIGFNT